MKTTQLWINNQWVEPDRYVPLTNPYSGDVVAQIGYASVLQVQNAIEVADQAFRQFRKTPAHQRAAILSKAADILAKRKDEAAHIVVQEAAKPITAARAEIERTIQTYQFAAEAAKSIQGETIPMDAVPRGENHMAFVQHRPRGVVSAITPFNFPFNLVAHKVGPAIAAGNTIVLKPAEQTPLSALFLADLFAQAGLPAGVLNIVPGFGHELGDILVTHPNVSYVTFTGSPRVGQLLQAKAGLRKITLELGSNSPLLIDEGLSDDDLEQIAKESTAGAFSYNGQICISIQRVYVHQTNFASFVAKLATYADKLVIGDPNDESTAITPLINSGAVSRLSNWLNHAKDRGCVIHTGGTFAGNALRPTVLSNVASDLEVYCEEVFGPIVIVEPYDNWDQAIQKANDSKYGLHVGVFTKDIDKAFRAADDLESGGILINQVPTFRLDHMPYGGVKQSGVGREGVKYAMEDMMEIQFVGFRKGFYEHR